MNIAIRVDASAVIGMGHLMRCLTLADMLHKAGVYVRFICRYIPKNLYKLIKKYDCDVTVLLNKEHNDITSDLAHAKWLGVNQEFDAQETLQAISDLHWDWIVVDHYALDYRWESIIKDKVNKLLVIDDLADRQHICDIFLNQNLIEESNDLYADKLPQNTIKLIGPKYALLRDEFIDARSKVKFREAPIKNILVFFGGADENNFTLKALEAIALSENLSLHVYVIIGEQHPDVNSIKNICNNYGYKYYIQTNKMAQLMLTADLAIGAAGSTSWERCCLGLPSLVVSIADNQIPIAEAVRDAGAAIYLGCESEVNTMHISDALNKIYHDKDRLLKMSKKAYVVTDGNGKDLVLEKMCASL